VQRVDHHLHRLGVPARSGVRKRVSVVRSMARIRRSPADVVEHHHGGPERADRVGDALAYDGRRRIGLHGWRI
jgi:hypothetical protein